MGIYRSIDYAGAVTSIAVDPSVPVRTITLNRPGVLNAFDRAMLAGLRDAVAAAVADPDVRAIVLTGGPRAFCTGEDLRAAQQLDAAGFRAQIDELQALATALREAPVPVLAAVAGPAFGGGLELAVNCDIRVAAASARFACPETRWALTITNGASLLLRRLVGEGWAREIALLGTEVDAETALRIGLVTRVVPDAALAVEVAALAARVAQLDREAVAATKRLLNADPAPWRAVLDAERDAVVRGFDSPAARARLASFGSKR
jgi:2-(1,2-epoxy-1,2-dihydrophenyl)acetyl-CoA isomerase